MTGCEMTGLCAAATWLFIVWFGDGPPQIAYMSSELACEAAARAVIAKQPMAAAGDWKPVRYVCTPR